MARPNIKAESDDDNDGVPLSRAAKAVTNGSNGNVKRKRGDTSESELSEPSEPEVKAPVAKRARQNSSNGSGSSTAVASHRTNGTNGASSTYVASKRKRLESSSESSDNDDTPLAAVKGKSSTAATANGDEEELSDDDDDDDAPLAAASKAPKGKIKEQMKSKKGKIQPRRSSTRPKATPVKEESDAEDSDSDDDDQPLATVRAGKAVIVGRNGVTSGKSAKEEDQSEPELSPSSSSSESDVPIARRKRASTKGSKPPASATSKAKPKAKKLKSDTPESSTPATPAKPKAKPKAKKAVESTPSKKARKKKEKEEEEEALEEVHRWWEQQEIQGDGTLKWNTLEHSGVLFPPAYQPLPSSVKMKYDGRDVTLSPEAEEVAGFYAAMLETEHAVDPKFQENFFRDWQTVLRDNPSVDSHKIKVFEKCDFRPMFLHFEAEKAAKKALSGAEKKALKEARDAMEAPYKECLLDGRKEKVGNFRIEPPGLFRGRGEHPKKGCLKFRVSPEDIVLNIGQDATIPTPNAPGQWGKVVHDQTVTWLANWKENVNGNFKYVFLAAGSSIKGRSDMEKFEKARELKKHVARIRQDYNAELRSKITADRQRATAMYFIDKLALRAGNEKGEDEADTVGCCSLRYEHVTLEPPNRLIFDFLGKDSIRYYNTVEVDPQVFKNMRIFKGDGKTEKDAIFDRVTTTTLNKHLQSYMKGLTAKVFRTYNASITFQEQLDKNTREDMTDAEKLAAYHEANRMVAILCNHQKSVSKTHGANMEKLGDKLRGLKYKRMKMRQTLFTLDPKSKKKHPELQEMESDIDDEFIERWEDSMKQAAIEKARKKFEKTNEALVAEGEKPQKPKVLEEQIEQIEEEFKELAEERGSEEVTSQGFKDPAKVLAAIDKVDAQIGAFKVNLDVKDKGKDVALGTSKINYLDPRITNAWCKKFDIPVTKLFSKTLIAKFPWAMDADGDWKF